MKNPFSIYDFLGYVFPGAFALIIVYYFVIIDPIEFQNPMSVHEMLDLVRENFVGSESIVSCTIFLIISYVLGHIISYLSSITVERFVIWWYGYPSEFMLNHEDHHWHFFHDAIIMCHEKKYHYKRAIIRTYILRSLFSLLLLPILIPTVLFRIFGCNVFFVKKLDPYLNDIVLQKRNALAVKLNLPDASHYDKVDYYRVIYNYVYEHSSNHRQKMDNYVALYDFLRSLTLIFIGVFIYVLWSGIIVSTSIGYFYWLDLLIAMSLSCVSFMAFFKFYRKFTLEAFMCLVSDQDLR